MQAFEFVCDAEKNLIEIPPEYSQLYSKHMQVVLLLADKPTIKNKYDFSDVAGKLKWQGDAVQEQRIIRDEW